MPPSIPSIPLAGRHLLAAACAAVLVSGCAQMPVDDGSGAQPESVTTPAPSAQPAPAAAPGTAVPATPPPSVSESGAHPGASPAAPLASPPDPAPPEATTGLTDDRRGLGLVPPPSGPMTGIDGITRPWEVPDIPKSLKQDPYRPSDQQGMASWYGGQFHGRKTANGERFNKEGFTAAHKTLPFGTQLCVRSMVTGKTVVVRVNDRGPYSGDRIIDLSQGAAQELGMLGLGIKPVEFWALDEDADLCPSFVLAGSRSGGKLAASPGHRAGGKQALVKDRATGRVHKTIGTRGAQPAAGSKSAIKPQASASRVSPLQRKK